MSEPPVHPSSAPPEFAAIYDSVCAADREWFNQHPAVNSYIRPYVPGEFWPHRAADGSIVEVTLLTVITETGGQFRQRKVIHHNGPELPPYDPAMAEMLRNYKDQDLYWMSRG